MKSSIIMLVLASMHVATGLEDNTVVCMFAEGNHCERCTVNYESMNLNNSLFGKNLTIQICSSEFHLWSVLTIAMSHAVTIQGMPSQIVCTNYLQTGIHIYEVTGLVLRDVELVSCGNVFSAPAAEEHLANTTIQFISSIYIYACTNIIIENVTIVGSKGNGISMFDNGGNIFINNSHFKNSSTSDHSALKSDFFKPAGSGLHIVLSYCMPRAVDADYNCSKGTGRNIRNSEYHIQECTFSNNLGDNSVFHHDNGQFSEDVQLLATGFGRGGGLSIVVDKDSTSNAFEITECNFLQNSAIWGGGLYISILNNAQNNTISISHSVFFKNSCSKLAGGGANIGFQAYGDNHPQGNNINFYKCRFTENRAVFGGGVSFYSSSSSNLPNEMIFKKCNWTSNEGDIGAAVNIAPQVWKTYIYDLKIKIIFEDCNFFKNYLCNVYNKQNSTSYKKGRGTLSAVGYRIWLKGNNTFDSNNNSALYLTSTEVELWQDSNTVFKNNQGFDGGAIYMLGFSSIIVNDDVNVTFTNNTALAAGGAIYQYTYDTRDFFASQSCFIRYGGKKKMGHRNITFLFQHNVAGIEGRHNNLLGEYGHSIYATTIEPCYKTKGCQLELYNVTFTCIGNFIFEEQVTYDISTAGRDTRLDKNSMESGSEVVWMIPGKVTELPIETVNDLSEKVSSVYHVSIQNSKSISLDSAFTYLSSKSIKLFGRPSDRGEIQLETVSVRAVVFVFTVRLQNCPPGYIHNEKRGSCECSVFTNKHFFCVRECDDDTFQAKLSQGCWVNYFADSLPQDNVSRFGSERFLLHATCPLGQCLHVNSPEKRTRLLPNTTSVGALDEAVCGISRTGVLCSKCRDGFAAHYHHSSYACKEGVQSCKIGWILYLVSEIAPVTIFFVIVMVFNINFTHGSICGFILFVQLSDTMLIKGNGYIQLPDHVLVALDVYRFITRIFNLNFFAIDSLSFCLWRKASTLDLLAFKYVTIFYASTLVVGIIVVFKYCHSKYLNIILVKMKGESAASTKSTIIHGVSGFLVICYSECTRISLLLLTPVPLYAADVTGYYVKQNVAFYNGELLFFRGKHLLYALPALVILLVLGVLPPLLLITYPLCYKVMKFLKMSETRAVKLLCTCIPLEKFKPFFDSFQSSYKDEYRFFSGLYFLYRFTTLATFASMSDLNTYYILVQVQLAVILTVHALCQPYKNRCHNILDSLLFVNLSIINTVTLFNFSSTSGNSHYMGYASTVQVILLYLPLVYITLYSIRKRYRAIRHSKVVSTLHYKLKPEHKPSTSDYATDYRELSSSFPLNAAENRIKDTIKF